MKHRRFGHGFTIVELMVVIVIIVILATVTAALYANSQMQARDSKRRDALAKVADALAIWSANHNNTFPAGGYQSTTPIANGLCADGVGQGWVAKGRYACTLEEVLAAANLLPTGFTDSLPASTTYTDTSSPGNLNLVYYPGINPRSVLIMTSLEDQTNQDAAHFQREALKCGYTLAQYNDTTNNIRKWGERDGICFTY